MAETGSKLIGTESSLMLTGWTTASSEEKLIAALSKYKCAWEIAAPSPEDGQAPVYGRFWRFCRGGRILFAPLEIKAKYVDIIRG
jgi:hypothetical protein